MARSVVLSNGHMLAGIDEDGRLRDLYYPHVGQENHISEYSTHRIGVKVNGDFRWVDRSNWDISIRYDEQTMASTTTARCDELGVELSIRDTVYNEEPIFLRHCRVTSLDDSQKELRLYFGQEFRISENNKGDTAYYDPRSRAIIHYKANRAFLVNAQLPDGERFDDYTVGLYQIEGHEGSYRKAQKSSGLGKNAIEHGSVDSILSIGFNLEPKKSEHIHYWIAAGVSVEDAVDRSRIVQRKSADHILESTSSYWNAWLDRSEFRDTDLPDHLMELFNTSLLITKAHADHEGGIIASSDSSILNQGRDTYAYVWPRDGAIIAMALDQAGDTNAARAFYDFAVRNVSREGYLMHKFLVDGGRGSSWHPYVRYGTAQLPIQEDETATVLFGIEQHYLITKDIEYIESIYNSFIKRTADFMLHYRDTHTGLPYGSYDLWEEKYGVHTYTACLVSAALKAAGRLADTLGKHEDASSWREGAHQIRMAILGRLWSEERQMFIKGAIDDHAHDHHTKDDTIDSSSWYAAWRYGICALDDEKITAGLETIKSKLWNNNLGGLPRYENDNYYRVSHALPPNPWIITTLWVAQYHIARNENEQAKDLLDWVYQRALQTGILPEQVNPDDGSPLSATPLTWSHAEYVTTIIEYIRAENSTFREVLKPQSEV